MAKVLHDSSVDKDFIQEKKNWKRFSPNISLILTFWEKCWYSILQVSKMFFLVKISLLEISIFKNFYKLQANARKFSYVCRSEPITIERNAYIIIQCDVAGVVTCSKISTRLFVKPRGTSSCYSSVPTYISSELLPVLVCSEYRNDPGLVGDNWVT